MVYYYALHHERLHRLPYLKTSLSADALCEVLAQQRLCPPQRSPTPNIVTFASGALDLTLSNEMSSLSDLIRKSVTAECAMS